MKMMIQMMIKMVMMKAMALNRVAENAVKRYRRYEPSSGLVSQSLSSKLTCEREMAHKALAHSSECVREREIGSQGS